MKISMFGQQFSEFVTIVGSNPEKILVEKSHDTNPSVCHLYPEILENSSDT